MNRETANDIFKRSVKTISNIPEELIDSLIEKCKLIHFKKGELFLGAGDVSPRFMLSFKAYFRFICLLISDNSVSSTNDTHIVSTLLI